MFIAKNSMVTLEYSVRDTENNLIDVGNDPIVYLHGGYNDIFVPIENALEGKKVGDAITVALKASEAFGTYDEEKVVTESLGDLPPDLEVGMQIEGYLDTNPDDIVLYTVVKIESDRAILDANHPLAGLDLVFSATVKAIHTATEEEIKASNL